MGFSMWQAGYDKVFRLTTCYMTFQLYVLEFICFLKSLY